MIKNKTGRPKGSRNSPESIKKAGETLTRNSAIRRPDGQDLSDLHSGIGDFCLRENTWHRPKVMSDDVHPWSRKNT